MISKLGRKASARKQVVRNLVTSLILYGQLETTLAKAKSIQPVVERLLNTARNDNLLSRRRLSEIIYDNKAISKIFEIATLNLSNVSDTGLTSIIKLGNRLGDASQMCLIKINPKVFEIKLPESAKKVDTL